MIWYAVVNDLIGGFAVSSVNKPLSQIDQTPPAEAYVIADCMCESDARAIATALMESGWVPLALSRE